MLATMFDTRAYPGASTLDVAGGARSAPSLGGAWAFTVAYGGEIPVITALLAAGVSPAVPGALLISLPAVSRCRW